MRKLAIFYLLCACLWGYDEIIISESEIRTNGIKVISVSSKDIDSKGMPFNALIDFDDKTSVAQSSSFETVVVNIYKREGEYVKKGDLICDISSNELSTLFFEFKNTRDRLKIASENEAKDKMLYESGVISKREYQLSYLTMNELKLKYNETFAKLDLLGVSKAFMESGKQGQYGFPIVAKASGVLSVAPRQSGQKINAFTPYVRISLKNSDLLGRIRVPVHLAHTIEKGDVLYDEKGKEIGFIDTISVVIDKDTNTILATAKITANDFKVGELVEVYIGGGLPENSMLIPSSAVLKIGNDYVTFVRTKNGFLPMKIEVTEERDNSFAIKKGVLKPNMQIATGSIIILQGMLSGLGTSEGGGHAH
ncbi:sodium:proton antiporter [Helicobacter sp. MIT 00-7814]|uniref:efflux RND transporter periplasmic adaptor subunit n=1 Tax=unclassified Helicobacter TaxID=2593540 RepID=UPI000E1EE89C|nr:MULTISPECIES: efflux RND transporter periplasmic adaptor subunit [unclassified Helicobacter]RDU57118.1 sodium:proton antiporter [Helicobacter sp. MIT 00-7814]RDU57669.1 sodium:proton antiporter [Helicobacter sp. MIT 99-10781]